MEEVLSLVTTVFLSCFSAYFLLVVGWKIRILMKRDSVIKLNQSRSADDFVMEESHAAIGGGRQDPGFGNRPLLALYVICFTLLLSLTMRCAVYITLVALPPPLSQLGCDLLLELVHLIYGLGLVLTYTFVWRIQRYFYYMKIFRSFYSSYIQFWSWCVVGFIALISAARLMILMSGWRFGVQYLSEDRFGCITDTFTRISRNVTETEWNLPFTYNISCGSVLFFLAGGLPVYLCIKAYSMTEPTRRLPGGKLTSIRRRLVGVTIGSIVSLMSMVVSQLIMLRLIPIGLPATLFNQIDDLATVLQVVAMIFCTDHWRTCIFPCLSCAK